LTLLCSLFRNLMSLRPAQVSINPIVAKVDEGGEQQRHGEFVYIICYSDREDLCIGEDTVKCDEQHHEAVDQLRHQRRAGGAKPELSGSRNAPEFLKDIYVYHLPDKKRCQRTHYNAETLTEKFVESKLDIEIVASVISVVAVKPEIGGREVHGEINGQERIADQTGGEVADEHYSRFTEVFVDKVSGDEYHRPKDRTGSKVKTHLKPEYIEVHRTYTDGGFRGEDLDAHHFGEQRVRYEYS